MTQFCLQSLILLENKKKKPFGHFCQHMRITSKDLHRSGSSHADAAVLRRKEEKPLNTEANVTVRSEGSQSVGGAHKPSTSIGLNGAHE